MNRLVSWFATNTVATHLLVAFLLLAGVISFARITVQIRPDLSVPLIRILVPYLGAAPEEVESDVCARVDERFDGIDGIDRVRSTAEEGLCRVRVDLTFEADRGAVLAAVQNEVNAIDTLPEATETPVVRLVEPSDVVVEVAVTGPSDERTLKELARRVRRDLLTLPAVTQASVQNVRPYEISVEISEASLQRNSLTFDQVAEAIRGNSVNLPGGSIDTELGELLLRTRGQADRAAELNRLEVATRPDGTRILLEDVAEVIDGFEESGQRLRLDGRPTALVRVSRVGEQDLRQIAEQVRRYVRESEHKYPQGVELTVWNDQSTVLVGRLRALLDSGLQGLMLVIVVLALFLRPHLALWVAVGIPIALFGAVFLLFVLGESINTIALTGFILVLGLLVDDAVVVGESVYLAQREGIGRLAGAIEGAQRVFVPVTFGVLTTMTAFLPFLFLAGFVGESMAAVAVPVICCLALSLIECQFVLPMHLGQRSDGVPLGEFGLALLGVVVLAAFSIAPDLRTGLGFAVGAAGLAWAAHLAGALRWVGTAFASLQARLERGLDAFINGGFRRAVRLALLHRQLTITIGLVTIGLALAGPIGGHLPFAFLIADEGDRISVKLTMPVGVPQRETDQAMAQLVASARALQDELARTHGEEIVTHIVEAYGAQLAAGAARAPPTGSHLGEIFLQLTPTEQRPVSAEDVAEAWRDRSGAIPGATQVVFETALFRFAPDLDIRLFGDNVDDLRAASDALYTKLGTYPGVLNATTSFRDGKDELSLALTSEGAARGLTLAEVGRQVRQAFYGEEAQRVQRGEDDLRIMVRYPREARRSLAALHDLHIRTPTGEEIPFRTAAVATRSRGVASIERVDGVRSVSLTAQVKYEVTSANAVIEALTPFLDELAANYPGVGYEVESNREVEQTARNATPLVLGSLFGMFAMLAIPLRSYAQPLVIMAVLPFCFVGAVFGHFVMMVPGIVFGFSTPSAFGLLAAMGVAINATLVLLHAVRRFRADGIGEFDAMINAAVLRCRPILITTVTTFIGLIPLMLSRNPAAVPLIPMVVSLAFGIVVSSVAALLFVPALWLALHEVGSRTRRTATRLGGIVFSAPRFAQWTGRYPFVKDALRQPEFTDLVVEESAGLDAETARIARAGLVRLYYQREFDRQAMNDQLALVAERAPNTDEFVAEVCTWAQRQAFQLGAHILQGAVVPSEAAGPLTDILDVGLAQVLKAVRRDFAAEHGEVPGSRTALVAFAAFGRREFVIGDTLPLLLLYDSPAAPSTFALDASAWHAALLRRLRRLVGELSAKGILFESDWRPITGDGHRTPACSLETFQGLCRGDPSLDLLRMLAHGRVVCADGDLGERFDALRRAALSRPRDVAALARAFSDLRVGAFQGSWDVYSMPGGLSDLERFVEHLQMTHSAAHPDLLPLGLAPAFEVAGERSLVEVAAGRELADAVRLWQNFGGFMSMAGVGMDPASLANEHRPILAQACGVTEFDALADTLAAMARRCALHHDRWLVEGARLGDSNETWLGE